MTVRFEDTDPRPLPEHRPVSNHYARALPEPDAVEVDGVRYGRAEVEALMTPPRSFLPPPPPAYREAVAEANRIAAERYPFTDDDEHDHWDKHIERAAFVAGYMHHWLSVRS